MIYLLWCMHDVCICVEVPARGVHGYRCQRSMLMLLSFSSLKWYLSLHLNLVTPARQLASKPWESCVCPLIPTCVWGECSRCTPLCLTSLWVLDRKLELKPLSLCYSTLHTEPLPSHWTCSASAKDWWWWLSCSPLAKVAPTSSRYFLNPRSGMAKGNTVKCVY